jgi:hypothetical protein
VNAKGLRRLAVALVAVVACGSRTGLPTPLPIEEPSATPDAGTVSSDAAPDAGTVTSDAAASCQLGTVVGNVFGQTVSFAGGAALAAGRYRVTYVGGCMKYNPSQDWSVNAYPLGDAAGSDHWWFISQGQQVTSVIPPGTVGFIVGQGGYATFDECVQANLAVPPVELTLPGGPLAVWLEDSPYGDNVEGPDGGAPAWSLECAP